MTLSKSRSLIFLIPILLLLIPLVAMQFTNEVDWTGFDFFLGGLILYFFATLSYFAIGKFRTFKSRFVILTFILIVLALVWAELAVGIFGTPFAGS